MKLLNVRIDSAHIKKGERCEPFCCPVSISIMEDYPGVVKVTTWPLEWANGKGYIQVSWRCRVKRSDGKVFLYAFSKAAEKWIRRFDAGKDVSPANFRFRLIVENA